MTEEKNKFEEAYESAKVKTEELVEIQTQLQTDLVAKQTEMEDWKKRISEITLTEFENNQTICEINEEKESLKQEVIKLEMNLKLKKDQFESEVHLKLEPIEQEMAKVHIDNKEKLSQITNLEQDIITLTSEKELLNHKLVQMETDLKVTQNQLESEVQMKLDPVEKEMMEIKLENDMMVSQLAALEEVIANSIAEKEMTKLKLVELETNFKIKEEEFETEIHLRLQPLECEMTVAKMAMVAKDTQLATLQEVVIKHNTEKESLNRKVVELETNLKVKEEEFETEIHLKIEPLERQMKAVKMEIVSKETELASIQEIVINTTTEREILKEKVVELETNLKVKEEEFETKINLKVEPLEKQMKAVKMEIVLKETELATLQEVVINTTTEKEILKEKFVELETILKVKEEEFETEIHLKVEPLEKQMKAVKMEIVSKESELVSLQEVVMNTTTEKTILKQKIVELETNLKVKEDEFETEIQLKMEPLEREMKAVKMKYVSKETEFATLQEFNINTTTDMKILKQKVVELETNLKVKEDEFETEIQLKLEPIEKEMKAVKMDIVTKQSELATLHESFVNTNSEKEILKEKVVLLETDLKVKDEEFATQVQLQLESVEREVQTTSLDNKAHKEDIKALQEKLLTTEDAMATVVKIKEELSEKVDCTEKELQRMVAKVEVLAQVEVERKELVEVLQEKELAEQEMRQKVAQLEQALEEHLVSRESLVSSLEVARNDAGKVVNLEEEVREVTATALLQLEKCRVVELELHEVTKIKEELGLQLHR